MGGGDNDTVTVASTRLLYQLNSNQLTPSSWYSRSWLWFLYSWDSSSFFQEPAWGRGWGAGGKRGGYGVGCWRGLVIGEKGGMPTKRLSSGWRAWMRLNSPIFPSSTSSFSSHVLSS